MLSKHAAAGPYVETMAKTAMDLEILKHLHSLKDNASWLLPLASATAVGVSTIADRMTAASRKANAFKAMMQANPHLADPRKPSEDVQRYFNVLYAMNPDFANEPTVAGSYVLHQLGASHPGAPHNAVFESALKLRGGGQGPKVSPMQSIQGSLEKTINAFTAKDDRTEVLRTALRDYNAAVKGREDKVRSRHLQMAKSRERGAQEKLDRMQQALQSVSADAARFQGELDARGIPY